MLHNYYLQYCYNTSILLISHLKPPHTMRELTCTASANKSTPFNMAARPSTPNRISFPVAIPRRDTLDRVDWMAERRRLREVLLSVFMIAIYVCWLSLAAVFFWIRIDAGVNKMDGWWGGEFWRAHLRRSKSFRGGERSPNKKSVEFFSNI